MSKIVKRRFVRLVRTVALVCVLTPFGAELALRLLLFGTAQAAAADGYILPTSPSAPYKHAPYWNQTWWTELQESGQNWRYSEDGLVTRPDFHGIYYNIRNSYRLTAKQPANARHTIWLVGSSTVYDAEVPDYYTKASYLQKFTGRDYRVEGRGIASITADKEVLLLKKLPIQVGDIVVFYDGAMDMLSAYRIAQNRQRLQPSACNFLLDRANWSVLIRALCLIIRNYPTKPDQSLIERTYESYAQAIKEAGIYTRSYGATFYHVLQPTIYSRSLNAYERTIWLDAGASDVYASIWPIFEVEPGVIDLTHSLDVIRGTGAAIYFDYVHTNEIGNEVIAHAIAAVIAPTF